MRLLFAVWLLLSLTLLGLGSSPNLLIFTNDGTFYRLDVEKKAVDWHTTLGLKLMSFHMDDLGDSNSKYFLPTIDGHFLYIDKHREVIVQRSQVEHLLDICFQGRAQEGTKYFVYEKFQYFVLNTQDGTLRSLEDYISTKKTLKNTKSLANQQPQEVILSISQKFLKQLNLNLSVRWSAISSTVNLISVTEFFDSPTKKIEVGQHILYLFQRSGPKDLKIISRADADEFQLESSSTIISILSYSTEKKKYVSHNIEMVQRHLKALGWDGSKAGITRKFENIQEHYNRNQKGDVASGVDFSGFEHFPVDSKLIKNAGETYGDEDGLLFCVNSFRNLQRLREEAGGSYLPDYERLINNSRRQRKPDQQGMSAPTIPFSIIGQRSYSRQKEQPVALIFSGLVFAFLLFVVYKVGVKKIIKELSIINDHKMEQLEKRLAKNVPKNIDSNMFSMRKQQIVRRTPQYTVYGGRFLNNQVNIYSFPRSLQIDIESRLDLLLKVSSKGICKIYYYTIEDQVKSENEQKPIDQAVTPVINIIVEKSDVCLSGLNIVDVMKNKKPRESMKQILDSLLLIADQLEFQRFVIQSIVVNYNQLKIDIIPSILQVIQKDEETNPPKPTDEKQMRKQEAQNIHPQEAILPEQPTSHQSCRRLKEDIVQIFYFLATKGEIFKPQILSKEHIKDPRYNQPNQVPQDEERQYSDPEFLLKDFLQFIQTQDDSVSSARFLGSISEHPYLWHSKQKMLFFTDFSNYMETHIDQYKLRKFENTAKDLHVIRIPWVKELHPSFTRQLNTHRKYDYGSVRDLIRVVRNKVSHFHELPRDVKNLLGKTPQEFVQYFLWKFPKLLPFMYVYSIKKRWKLLSLNE